MNKYNLGTILGVSLLGLAKNRFGSKAIITRRKSYAYQYAFWASVSLENGEDYEIGVNEDGFTQFTDEYWLEMDKIQKENVNPELFRKTLIEKDGLTTFIESNIVMQPYDDGDPYITFGHVVIHCIANDFDIFNPKLLRDEITNRYTTSPHLDTIIGSTRKDSLLSETFKKFGLIYEFRDFMDDPINIYDQSFLFYIDKKGEEKLYRKPKNNRTKLRKR